VSQLPAARLAYQGNIDLVFFLSVALTTCSKLDIVTVFSGGIKRKGKKGSSVDG
jgi:hypothetical protein